MTRRDDIIRMAREVGIVFANHTAVGSEENLLQNFAALVAAAEREACAKVCEQRGMVKGGEVFAARIRARGKNA